MRLPQLVAALVALAGFSRAQPPSARAPRFPAEFFFEPTRFISPKLSPNGSKVCVLTRYDDTRYELSQLDVQSKQMTVLAKSDGTSVTNFWWKNDELILVLVSIDALHRDFRAIDFKAKKLNSLPGLKQYYTLELLNAMPEEPEQMLFLGTRFENTVVVRTVRRINVRTGEEKHVEDDHTGIQTWFVNRTGGVVAGWGKLESEQAFLLWKAPNGKWQRRYFPEGKLLDFVPVAVAPDEHRLLVKDYRGHPTSRICYYDLNDGSMEEVVPAGTVEPTNFQVWGYRRVPASVTYEEEKIRTHFFLPEAKARHEWLETVIPGCRLTCLNFSQDDHCAIVFAANDRNPGVYCLANFETKKITVLGLSSKFINPDKMASSRAFTFCTSDGMTIRGRITLPLGIEKPPLIVRVPEVGSDASDSSFDPDAQFLANRGYASVLIDHRGKEGFGRDFLVAGDFQTDTGMVRDISEGLDWVKSQGWIDGDRVALLSEDQGGIVALPLAVKSTAFRALLNFGSPIEYSRDLADFATSGRNKSDLIAAIGGSSGVDAFFKTHRSFPYFEQLNVPSFHFYRGPQSAIAGKLTAILKKRPQPFEILNEKSLEGPQKEKLSRWQEKARTYEAAVAFLDKHLASAPR